ncbi:hypothetical protein PIB30_020459 [Stylosanthes scabra]|uniref:Cytochrome P450 n=1 Tax=Stylosanthes scabra TaxID=79078 RepID=A0ABU6VA31_9FABA|nr:hypothetical protein [Stylosanthes scabra]
MEVVKLVCSIGVLGMVVVVWVVCVYGNEWVKSQRVRRKLRMQGISGPPPSFLQGNLLDMQRITAASQQGKVGGSGSDHTHDFTESLFPYFEFWRKQYANVKLVLRETRPPWSYITLYLRYCLDLLSAFNDLHLGEVLVDVDGDVGVFCRRKIEKRSVGFIGYQVFSF